MAPEEGFEPSTSSLGGKHSIQLSYPGMRKKGFEPSQALSYWSLSPARLTTPALPHKENQNFPLSNLPLKYCSRLIELSQISHIKSFIVSQ